MKGRKPCKAAVAICRSMRGTIIVAEPRGLACSAGGCWEESEGVEYPTAAFCIRSLSFWEMYSNTDRGAEGRGVSPRIDPRYNNEG